MKIIIMKCSGKESWYKNSIGKTFKVASVSGVNYNVIAKNPASKGKSITLAVLKQDAEVIEK